MHREMTLERLTEIVEAYGASPLRWPVAEREAAKALLAREPHARALADDARKLDAFLDAAPDGLASDALVSRIMAARPRAVPTKAGNIARGQSSGGSLWRALVQTVWPYGSPAFPAGALAASVMLGVTLGLALPSAVSAVGLSTATTTATTASATTNAAGEQLVAFALAENEYPEDWQK